jgi:hypothetical protein
MTSAQQPGRNCPLHYRYRPSDFAVPASSCCEVLYVVGGLYGNVQALHRVLDLFELERGDKRLVFNGDFHWFDIDARAFSQVQRGVLAFEATRGNVETELAASPDHGGDSVCGCAYPDWVGDAVVERSNRILATLRHTARAMPGACRELATLPMWRRNEELIHRRLVLPRSSDGDGAVTESGVAHEEQILNCPPRAAMNRIMDDLAAHLQPVHVAPRENVVEGRGFGGEFHVSGWLGLIFFLIVSRPAGLSVMENGAESET